MDFAKKTVDLRADQNTQTTLPKRLPSRKSTNEAKDELRLSCAITARSVCSAS
jgi:hypothetical protein